MNKRIGILTFHRSINNGAVLQCFALQQKIKKDFPSCNVEVIDFNMPKTSKIYPTSIKSYMSVSNTFYEKIRHFGALLLDPTQLNRNRKKRDIFYNAIKKLPLSDEYIFEDGTEHLFNYINEKYDIVIAGSDVIWNYEVRGFPNPYFLSDKLKVDKFSYAASCNGMNYENISKKEMNSIKTILDSYRFIGVRDIETEKFFEMLDCDITCNHTCDPTFLLNLDDLPVDAKQFEKKLNMLGFDFQKKTIAVMGTEEICRFVKSIMGPEYQIVALFNNCKSADINLYSMDPFEWAYSFRYFCMTFTTYFHGTILSLKYGLPTICFSFHTNFNTKHISKVQDLLGRLNLEDLFFDFNDAVKNPQEFLHKIQELDIKKHEELSNKMALESESYAAFYHALKECIEDKKK